MEELKKWIEDNLLDVNWVNPISFKINDETYLCLQDREQLFDFDFQFNLHPHEREILLRDDYDYYVFKFGHKFYYSPTDKVQLNEFRYIWCGKVEEDEIPYLGIHGQYELCNGSKSYSEWVKKAKFLNITTLGLCEKNTLAGTILFQKECVENDIKPILGETVSVLRDDNSSVDIKLYVENKKGWNNLLHINKSINVDNVLTKSIPEEKLFELSEGLVCVLPMEMEFSGVIISKYKKHFSNLYYQIDPSIYSSPEIDKKKLDAIKNYLIKFIDIIPCVLISDAYYLEKEDSHIKKKLNLIGKLTSGHHSFDQYFKPWKVVIDQIEMLFKPNSSFCKKLITKGIDGLKEIESICDFQIPLGESKLPVYEFDQADKLVAETSEDLFWFLINKGLEEKVISKNLNLDEYLSRIETEVDIISRGGFIDYFLILYDIIRWCENNEIMVGFGRGSSGGSLVAYLIGVTKLDPIKYGLIFERFLNESRIGKGLPDIDSDFAAERRDEVKEYIRNKYGNDYVCSGGSYTTFAARGALKDLARIADIDFQKANYVSGALNKSYTSYVEIFEDAQTSSNSEHLSTLKAFIKENYDIFNDIGLILNQPKSQSITASAVIIVPKQDKEGNPMTIYDWMPVRADDKGNLISEWQKDDLEEAGFLKEDILGLSQLDKISNTFRLIKLNNKSTIGFDEIQEEGKIDDPKVYDLFHKGLNQDVFQFGTTGLIGYCQEVKPTKIDDLIAINALYRPAVMEIGAHNKFVSIRNGDSEPEYDWGMEEITKDTLGVMIFQEQTIKTVQKIGGFDLTTSEIIRKAIGKKIKPLIEKYKPQFIKGAVENGCSELDAKMIWHKIELGASYNFNKSHSAAYSLLGYLTQYLKHYHPVEFWTTSLQYAKEDELPYRINEIARLDEHIKLMTPDINKSTNIFNPDFEKGIIYWSLSSIPYVGDAAYEAIINERNENGEFFSIEEFKERVPAAKVKINALENLILSGSFDLMYGIDNKKPKTRMKLMEELYSVCKRKLSNDYLCEEAKGDIFWVLKQRELIGLGSINYEKMLSEKCTIKNIQDIYCSPDQISYEGNVGKVIGASGILTSIVEKKTRSGNKFARLIVDNNNQLFEAIIWPEQWTTLKKEISGAKGKIIALKAKLHGVNEYNKTQMLQSDFYNTQIQVL